jgi:hypothetical protein
VVVRIVAAPTDAKAANVLLKRARLREDGVFSTGDGTTIAATQARLAYNTVNTIRVDAGIVICFLIRLFIACACSIIAVRGAACVMAAPPSAASTVQVTFLIHERA